MTRPAATLVLFLAAGSLTSAHSQIRIRLYDYAGVSSGTLADAKSYVREGLGRAGVELVWASCSADPGAKMDDLCEQPYTAMDLQLRILDERMAKRTQRSRNCLGFAMLGAEFPFVASVFFERALDLEAGRVSNRSSILGAMIAHELGHLLLEKSYHAPRGMMRANWGKEDIRSIARGQLWFAADELALIRGAVARRRSVAASEE